MYDYYSVVTNSLPKFVCLREYFFCGGGGGGGGGGVGG